VQHADRFEQIADLHHAHRRGRDIDHLSELEQWAIRDSVVHDVVFPRIDLNWWNVWRRMTMETATD
jgi:hypothetical protein